MFVDEFVGLILMQRAYIYILEVWLKHIHTYIYIYTNASSESDSRSQDYSWVKWGNNLYPVDQCIYIFILYYTTSL